MDEAESLALIDLLGIKQVAGLNSLHGKSKLVVPVVGAVTVPSLLTTPLMMRGGRSAWSDHLSHLRSDLDTASYYIAPELHWRTQRELLPHESPAFPCHLEEEKVNVQVVEIQSGKDVTWNGTPSGRND